MIDSTNSALVHHLLMYECGPTIQFNDSNLPDGLCDNLLTEIGTCLGNIATGWAIGGDYVRFFEGLNQILHKNVLLKRCLNFHRKLVIQLVVIFQSHIM